MEQETNINSWLAEEKKMLEENKPVGNGEILPGFKPEENKIIELMIDAAEPFKKWENPEDGVIKKLIPVIVDNERFIWWLNVKNPVYSEIIDKLNDGVVNFKVLRVGQKQNTRYTLVE